jgi:hypothetical protein
MQLYQEINNENGTTLDKEPGNNRKTFIQKSFQKQLKNGILEKSGRG